MVDFAGSGDFLTIQEAIDAVAPGDTIQVAEGHYREQLILENQSDIFILGSGVDVTFVESPDTLHFSIHLNGYEQYPAVAISACENIGFAALTLDGRGQGVANNPFHGFGYFNSGGSLQDLVITGFREDPLGYGYHGNGVFAVDQTTDGRNLNMENIQILDFQKTGILLHGQNFKSTSSNIVVVGQGSVLAPSQNGWQVSGMAELTASHCSASGFDFQPSTYVATGMLGTEDTKMNLTDCNFDSCEVGLFGIGNTTSLLGGTVTNAGQSGIMGKSFLTKSLSDEPTAQPIVLGGNFNKSDGSVSMYLTDVNVTGIDAGNSWGVALLSDNQGHMELENVNISHFAMGLVAYEGFGEVTGTARNCTFFDNFPLAAFSNTAIAFDARFNNWGHPSGPFHRGTNPLGLGNEAFGPIRYSPFAGGGALSIKRASDEPVACGEPVLFTVSYEAGDSTPDLFMYNIQIRGGEGLHRPVDPVSLTPWGGTELFMHYDTGDSSITVTGSTVGGSSQPLAGPGTFDLFTVEISAAADSGGFVFLENVTLRDPLNESIPSSIFRAELFADCKAPSAVSNITATTHHNRIGVTWDHDGEDVDHFEIFSGVWHDGSHVSVYPEYDDLLGNTLPERPNDHAEIVANDAGDWSFVSSVSGQSGEEVWSDSNKRGVYYYEVFAVDSVGNASLAATGNDHAANYWLGDVANLDGFVGVYDITILGASFGASEGNVHYNNNCDYGPTDDGTATGIPLTDNIIGFEDLMIVAMNFDEVSDENKNESSPSGFAALEWAAVEPNLYALRLVGGEGVKGVRVQASVPYGEYSLTAGALLGQQDEHTFIKDTGSALDVSLAVMGQGHGFEGQGDLILISTGQAIMATDLDLTVRGYDNSEISVSLNESAGLILPKVFAVEANHPNPFNPSTTIAFSLPESQNVLLKVYGVDGRVVATLVHESRSAGRHEVIWQGRNDAGQAVASGTYFYRIEAGPYSQVRKMSLMK